MVHAQVLFGRQHFSSWHSTWYSVGLPGAGQKLGAGMLEMKQLPCCVMERPAFMLANEAEPSSVGYVNTGF